MKSQMLATTARTVGKWIPVVLLALLFLPAGWSKFSDTSGWARAFRNWGFPDWFRITIGVVEIAAVLLLLRPSSAPIGALLIIVTMFGGMTTHFVLHDGRHVTSEIVPIVLAVVVLLIRRPEVKRFLKRDSARTATRLEANE